MTDWPLPADFAAPPTAHDLARWDEADRAARPGRLTRLRERFAEAGVDAYFGVRREHMRYLTGFTLAEGEEKVAGNSGQFLVSGGDVAVLADSRYTLQVHREAPGTRLVEAYHDLPTRWPELMAAVGARRVAVEAGFVPHAVWQRLAAAAPDVELVPIDDWVEADRAIKEPAEVERITAACAVADRALAALLPDIRAGITETALALQLEWSIRTGGAEALAFDVACLAGPEAALPHGAPGDRPVLDGAVLLFDFGAQVGGISQRHDADAVRRRAGGPRSRHLRVVARAQAAAIAALEVAVARWRPTTRCRAGGRSTASPATSSSRPGTGLISGTDRARDRARHPRGAVTGRMASDAPLPTPTVFSVEPGVYLEGEMGVRIEDLVLLDAEAGQVERLTRFPREVLVVGG